MIKTRMYAIIRIGENGEFVDEATFSTLETGPAIIRSRRLKDTSWYPEFDEECPVVAVATFDVVEVRRLEQEVAA